MGQIVALAEHAASASEMIERDNMIAGETKESKIAEIRAKSIAAVLDVNLKIANINKTEAEIVQISNDIQQKWKALELTHDSNIIKAFEAQLKAEYPGIFNVMGGALNGIIRILSGNKKFQSSENPLQK